MQSSSFPTLSEEILDLILSHLRISVDQRCTRYEDHDARNTVISACLVNKTFYRLALPKLYKTIILSRAAVRETGSPCLIRTLLDRPNLAEYVHHLVLVDDLFQTWTSESYPLNGIHCLGEEQYSDALASVLRDEDWFEPKITEKTVVLAICTSIRSLVLNQSEGVELPSQHFLELLEDRRDEYSSLREIRVEGHGHAGKLRDVQEALQMPVLENFVGTHTHCGRSTVHSDVTSVVKRAEFYESAFDARGLASFLRACPVLKSIMIQWPEELCSEGENLSFEGIGGALRTHGIALETVDLRAQQAWFLSSGMNTPPPLGDLSVLSCLRHFSAPSTAFFDEPDWDDPSGNAERKITQNFYGIFPRTLETLRIYDAFLEGEEAEWDQVIAQVLLLVQAVEFAALHKVVVEIEKQARTASRPSYEQVRPPSGWKSSVLDVDEKKQHWVVQVLVLTRE